MAHYAFLDENNIVTQVITGKDEGGDTDWETYYGNLTGKTCKRTSYNSKAGQHSMPDCECFRKNYAGIGFSYDETRDAFIPPKPYNSWVLVEDSCTWEAPVPMPTEPLAENEFYVWNEETTSWIVSGGSGSEKPSTLLSDTINSIKGALKWPFRKK